MANKNGKSLRAFRAITIIGLVFILLLVILAGNLIVFRTEWELLLGAEVVYDEDNIGEITCNKINSGHIAVDGLSDVIFINNEILITAAEKTSYKDIEKLAESYNATIVGWIEQSGDYQWQLSRSYTLTSFETLIHDLKAEKEIDDAYVNYLSEVTETSVVYGSQWDEAKGETWDESEPSGNNWYMESIHAISAWDFMGAHTSTISPVRVGVIDSQFRTSHEDLIFQEGSILCDITELDHGSMVAGILGANADNAEGICGVYSYGSENLYVSATDAFKDQNEDTARYSSVMIEKCTMANLIFRNVKVIVSSRTDYSKFTEKIENAENGYLTALEHLNNSADIMGDFLSRMLNMGYDFLIVTAAGNDSEGTSGHLNAAYASTLNAIHAETYPEVYARILVVGAVDTDYTICDFSNGGDRVDVYAPGENIASTSAKGYNVFSGTSTAAPQVAGAAACVWFINSGLTGSDVKSIISGTAYASNAEIGVSLLNVYATVTTAQQQADNTSEQNALISGFVFRGSTPIAEVTLTAQDGTTYTTETNEYGCFFCVVPDGTYTLSAVAGNNTYIYSDDDDNIISITVSNGAACIVPLFQLRATKAVSNSSTSASTSDTASITDSIDWETLYENALIDTLDDFSSNAAFELIYLDDDDIPEVVVSDSLEHNVTLFTIDKTTVTSNAYESYDGFFAYIQKNSIFETQTLTHGVAYIDTFYTYTDSTVEVLHTFRATVDGTNVFEVDGNECTETEFSNTLSIYMDDAAYQTATFSYSMTQREIEHIF
ncbi:MAG: S8 family serine peptidase [Ruminococcus sp.]|nr:S8 family serine peptidase [Ruminococcus sp.]